MAWLIDSLVTAVAVLLGSLTQRISALMTDTTELVGTSAWEVTSGGRPLEATEQVWDDIWGSAVSAVQQAFVALVFITFAYHFTALVLTNRRANCFSACVSTPTGPATSGPAEPRSEPPSPRSPMSAASHWPAWC
ncbi:hypothetical protein ACFQ60_01710 [Streptomyces zhihengii]